MIVSVSLAQRFWSYVEISEEPPGCWEWCGAKTNGYGAINDKGKVWHVHRLMWLLVYDREPIGCVCRSCVNPSHLFEGTIADNNHDMWLKGKSRGGRPVLTEETVREIRKLRAFGHTIETIASRVGHNAGTVNDVTRGITWKHVQDD